MVLYCCYKGVLNIKPSVDKTCISFHKPQIYQEQERHLVIVFPRELIDKINFAIIQTIVYLQLNKKVVFFQVSIVFYLNHMWQNKALFFAPK